MSVFLQILKITGLVLLAAVLIIFLLVSALLFIPVKYRMQGSYHDKKLYLKGRIYLFLHLFVLYINGDESGFYMYLRILGIKKQLSGNNLKKSEDTIKDTGSKFSVKDPTAEHELQMLSIPEDSQHDKTAPVSGTQEQDREEQHPQKRRSAFWKNLRQRLKRLQDFFNRLRYLLTHIRNKSKDFFEFINDKENRAALKKLKESLFSLFKRISPRKSSLDLKYSAGSPDITGGLLGVLALFPFGYKYHWNILPDFAAENAYAEADFDIRGRLYGIQILVLFLGIVLDKNCQKLYNKIMTMK